ncbi:glycosyltransferase [Phocaeicola plebeius]|jgi:glycosyltransferase involved in cell wall biosynthesis|uniref:Glycosyltransferase n=1 Tax=Phocaeicola plebeius TaxID=310297 RepID=A0A412H6D6_9BACT|nr:glycosyltransferase [Phocaeicola plebeius]RGR89508.1 glycosyltransferase [Phocaeicola plebeius]RGS07918.1 glycosyltransferase [Phocaeicola plebeius]
MKTILWIYEKALNPEDGGTERISDLIMKGLTKRGYICLGFLEFHKNDNSIIYNKQYVNNVYTFLKNNNIDIVINQLGYNDWLLKQFYKDGGSRWKEEGGKVITCLHFDPKSPKLTKKIIFHDWRKKSTKEKIDALKRYLLSPYYEKREENSIKKTYKYLYEYSDLFVMLSKTHYQYFKTLLKLKDFSKLRAIPNPLTFPTISSPDILNIKKKQVLIVARMSEYHKNISFALKVWKRLNQQQILSEWQLILVGDGPDKIEYQKYAKKNNLHNVIFKGQQNPEKFYEESSIFLMTSPAEGWGLTITESLQRGVVPIVMNSSPVFSEIIDNGINGFLTRNKSLNNLSYTLSKLIKNTELRQMMAKRALQKASKFTIDSVLNQWEQIIR